MLLLIFSLTRVGVNSVSAMPSPLNYTKTPSEQSDPSQRYAYVATVISKEQLNTQNYKHQQLFTRS